VELLSIKNIFTHNIHNAYFEFNHFNFL